MKQQGSPFDASEPPGGDFASYVERLNAASAAQAAEEAAGHATRARQAQGGTSAPLPASWGPPSTLSRASALMIGAGIALVLLAVLSSGSAFVDTFLPGMLLIGAGLAFRKHFRKR